MISVKDLTIGYDGKRIAGNISFSISPGECILLCGANGSGKSTLLKTLAGVCPSLGGTVSVNCGTALIPARIPRVKGFSLKEFITSSLWSDCSWNGKISPETEERILCSMQRLGIGDLAESDISRLSDGEFQKGCIASAIARNAELIILDEPTAFLDVDSRRSVLALFRELTRSGQTSILFSSHDIAESAASATRILGFGLDSYVHDSSNEGKTAVLAACFRNNFSPSDRHA